MFIKMWGFRHPHFLHTLSVLLDDEGEIWFLLRSVLLNSQFVNDRLTTFNNFTNTARLIKVEEIKHLMKNPKNFDCIDGYYFIDTKRMCEYIKRTPVDKVRKELTAWFGDIIVSIFTEK